MEREIEVKVLNVDLDQVEQRLIQMGAKLIAEEAQVNTVIDSKDMFIQKELNSYLRIRETTDLMDKKKTINLTLKKNIRRQEARQNVEISTKIDNKEAMVAILKDLGYHVVGEGFKKRKSYVYDGIRFDLDIWDEQTYPYPYMEIEVKDQKDLERAMRLLDIDKKNISTKSITELREELERSRDS
ncbi:MAG: class IV adenylate cyclase [Tissierellia bacterium]|mgnify:CR=1 FL=1|nr:class IV adenylate cyclase [Tissierellia bacterium]